MEEQYCPGLCEATPFIMTWYVPPDKDPGQCTYCKQCVNKLGLDTTGWLTVESSNAFCDNKKSFTGRCIEKDGMRLSLKKRNSHYRYPVTDNKFIVDPFTHFNIVIENLNYYDEQLDLNDHNIANFVGKSFFSIDEITVDNHDIMFHFSEFDLYKQFLTNFEPDPKCNKLLYTTYKITTDHMLIFIPLLTNKQKTNWNKYKIKVSKWVFSDNNDILHNYAIECFSHFLLRDVHLQKTNEIEFEFSLETNLTDFEKYTLFIQQPFDFSILYDVISTNFNKLILVLDKTKIFLENDYEFVDHIKQQLNKEVSRNFDILVQYQAEIDEMYAKYGDTVDHEHIIEI